jgi:hypothetical protein
MQQQVQPLHSQPPGAVARHEGLLLMPHLGNLKFANHHQLLQWEELIGQTMPPVGVSSA